ncbi:hypothetical protein [Fusobacterium nucleatum]|uniref:DUF4367 domain-containing protein n=2 Tax=Fusobacterium nucleatum subsp. nucleatum TaxID=76856 RepID=Q8RFS4_FUSNN|nr:hypothetical protein [Fusobacterium nucleatum]AAL94809.1 Hypothetical protein FN0613 [Fusobacterium nucleatum subsp. nucleatum ATCC 25586]ALF25088.1 D-tyrosyl-tRNA(Tyr) deacylase [Fusobacterium nucleatum subsp. nucleatum]AVQ15030.1 DUF4367 domain-containing protein [Fusobacterium nucleatum subsp. nucleatum ATCC 25586]KUL98408.1 D-tyrosyl-tRNA(Tyr) deacylase [Fusobacterium nucleatum subsp. nucleatum]MCG6843193.1 DUF4367 domain-containing protein [Fusobacterium nucleatum]
MKKILLILLICLATIVNGVPNPFIKVNTMDEAFKMTGFTLETPATYKNYKKKVINVIKNKMIEVVYLKESNTEGLFIRKSKGTYKTNKDIKTVKIGDYDVREKTKEENISLATWTDGTYSYVINPNGTELNAEDMAELILSIK